MTKKTKNDGLVTAGELESRHMRDPEWVAAKFAEDAEREKKRALMKELEAPLEQELRAAGVVVKSYRYVGQRPTNFRLAIPILIRHMQMDKYPEPTKNSMAQAIALKESNSYWDTLQQLFEETVSQNPKSIFAQGLAVALSKSWSEPQLERLIALCLDQKYGDYRILLANGLRKSKDSRADAALLELADDPRLGAQVTSWLKKRGLR